MEAGDKKELFAAELLLIVDPDIRECAEWMVGQLPDYFYDVAASSSGRYHPPYALGKGGLLRHTQAAVRLANSLLLTRTFGDQFTRGQKDALLLALIIHDGLKHSMPKKAHTVKNHPMLVRPYFEERISAGWIPEAPFWLNDLQRAGLYALVESHMGEWNGAGTEKMPKPNTPGQKFVHLCDFLASRKSLDFNFDA